MLNTAKTLNNYKLHGRDGEIGKVKEFYFDDQYWAIRYLIADTGNWLTGRLVLISPHALMFANKEDQNIVIDLTKRQIEDSPSLDTDKPVSRQFEEAYYGYYGWPMYWSGEYMGGSYPYLVHDSGDSRDSTKREEKYDRHLRSTQELCGYTIKAVDSEIGHVDDFIIDDERWTIRYLIVDTRDWWPGKKVLIAPKWIDRISWDDSKVFVNLTREAIKQSPEYTEASLLTRDYENELHKHYNRRGYWVDEIPISPLAEKNTKISDL